MLEEVVDVFGSPPDGLLAPRDVLVGRIMFWCWLGAYIHSVDLTVRHYLAHDLPPNVYVNAAKRFIVAFVVGTLVGITIASAYRAAKVSFNSQLVAVYVVCFFIGLFPDTGIKYIKNYASRILQQKNEDARQKPLSMIEGISLWQQGRLDQEDILNVQNLASADLLSLVAVTPFDVGQIVDWVDQSILLIYACPEQLVGLRKAGIRLASTVLKAFEKDPEQLQQASGLNASELYILYLALKPATNMELIGRYRGRKSRRWQAESSLPVEASHSPAD